MKPPKVSVLFPVYNGAAFIEQSIQSILGQSFTDFELLLMDDGSSDNSFTIMQAFKDPRIRLLQNEKNQGLIFTLNRGIKEAKGEFLARMDADDVSFPERFEKQVHYLEQHPDVGVCGTLMTCHITDRIYKHRFFEPEQVKAALVFTNPIVHPSVMMRRSLFISQDDFYSKSYLHAEDYALWVSLITRTKCAVLPHVLIRYGAHDQQMSRMFNATTRQSVKKAQEMIFEFLELETSEEEKQLHLSLFYEEYRKEAAYVGAAEKWMQKLMKANAEKPVFDPAAFAQITGEWWFRLNRELSLTGLGSYTRFKKSPLSKGFQPPAKSILKLRVKSILKPGKSKK